jgi:hypothetical protein
MINENILLRYRLHEHKSKCIDAEILNRTWTPLKDEMNEGGALNAINNTAARKEFKIPAVK